MTFGSALEILAPEFQIFKVRPQGFFNVESGAFSIANGFYESCDCVVENFSRSKIEYLVKAKTQFKSKSIANNVEIIVPVPPDVDSPSFKSNVGTVRYVPDTNCMVWLIKQFPGRKEFQMRASFGFPSVEAEERQKYMRVPI